MDGGQPKNFLRPCLLLLLRESPAHGYDLLDQLRDFAFDRDAGGLYRTLRALEHEGLVVSSWEPSLTGPDRRTYGVTQLGLTWLDAWANTLQQTHAMLGAYLDRYSTGRVTADRG